MEVLLLIFVFLTLAFDIVLYIDVEHLVDNTLDIAREQRKLKKMIVRRAK